MELLTTSWDVARFVSQSRRGCEAPGGGLGGEGVATVRMVSRRVGKRRIELKRMLVRGI